MSSPAVAAHDAVKEGIAMWLVHLVFDGSLRTGVAKLDRRLQAEVMKWTCLHPGHWGTHVGAEVLKRAASDVREDWEPLWQASRVNGSIRSDPEGEETQALPTQNRSASGDPDDGEQPSVSANSWTRAITPVEVPIGIIAC